MARAPHPSQDPATAGPLRWWTRWWGALLLGLVSLLLVAPGVMIAVLYATIPGDVLQGTTRATETGISTVLRVLAIGVALVLLAWPALTVRWCLKRWGGWMLVGLGGSLVAFVIALFPIGVL